MNNNDFRKVISQDEITQRGILAHVFSAKGNYYVYDTISSDIFKVNSLLGKSIRALSKETKSLRQKKINELVNHYPIEKIFKTINQIKDHQKNKGIFLPPPQKIKIVVKKASKETGFKSLVLEITQDCNFKCVYCTGSGYLYNRKRHSHNSTMSKDIALRSIKYFLNHTLYKQLWISFYGGEPLLQKELIKKCMSYARNIQPNVQFSLQTNGYLLDKDFFKNIKKHDAFVGISLDGPKHIHDQYRIFPSGEGTFDRIFSNLLEIAETDLEYVMNNFFILMTLTSTRNVNEILEFFEKYPWLRKIKIGINNIGLMGLKRGSERFFEIFSYDNLGNKDNLLLAMNKYVNMYKSKKWQYLNLEHALFFRDLNLIRNRKPLSLPNFRFRKLCPLGGWRLFVNVDGNFQFCEKSYSLPIVGNIKKGINWELVKKMEQDFLSTCHPCYNCWALSLCNICWVHLYNKPGIVEQKIKDKYCNIKRKNFSNALSLYINITEGNLKAFEIVPSTMWG